MDDLFKIFIQNRDVKSGTIELYSQIIKDYSKFLDKTPSEWISEAESEEEKDDPPIRMRNRSIKKYLLNYKDHLVERDLSPRTISTRLTVVRFFYSDFNIDLPRSRSKKIVYKEGIEDLPSRDEIKLALSFSNIKYQSVILLMLSSGMRSSDIRALKYSDFLTSLKDYIKIPKKRFISVDEVVDLLEETSEIIIPTWRITAIKTNTKFFTFSSPESLEKIIEYLKSEPPKTLNRYLFRSGRYPDKPISSRAFMGYFNYLNKKCGLGKPYKQNKLRSHALRKYFGTTLGRVGLQQLTIDRLMAHKVDAVTDAYIKPDITSLKEQYMQCVEELSIENVKVKVYEVDSKDKKRLDSLEKKYEELLKLHEEKDEYNKLP
ncbi:tyrosine-type recombinase/integrase [Methanobacterium spitsbergense]|uniref:Site-specific integrase n=1 Tax=Methanobacterium spitsbergense TaxID=2874285 RepID=A0A8T5V131_9EURY|nr:tyrosine-type recombinase/integrase [Methanobacterium spitsbergense]MBZ2165405.1 site-specific integrase [Methanobacterium spitsbergense]